MSDARESSLVRQRANEVQAARPQMAGLPREAMRGYPVPVLRDGDLYLAFPFFLRKGFPPAPPRLTNFGWIAQIDVATGKKVFSRALQFDPTVEVGEHVLDPSLDMKKFTAAEDEMFRLMSKLLPIAGKAAPRVPEDLSDEARRFADLWRLLAHKPLAAQYRALNPGWFAALGL